MSIKRHLKYFVLLLVLASLITSCAAPATPTAEKPAEVSSPPAAQEQQPAAAPSETPVLPTPTPIPTQAPETGVAKPGGEITLIIPEEPTVLNVYLTDAAIARQVADATSQTGLVGIDSEGNVFTKLAVDLPTEENGGISADHLTVTWKLKPNLKWSDGNPLTSDDVKFTWEAVSNPQSGVLYTGGFDKIASIETPNETTVIVKYSEPYPAYQTQFYYGIFPRHATGDPAAMNDWEWNRKPVGAGPYIVTEWNAGESIVMEKNPNYFEEGKPYIDRLVYKIVPESASQSAMMSQGDGDVHLWPGESNEDYNNMMQGKAKLVTVPGIWNMAIDFNLSKPGDKDPGAGEPHPIFGDIRVRQAIAHAIDYNTLSPGVVKDTYPSTNPFAYGWYKCDIPRKYNYDPETAKKLLEEAGWVEGSDGIRVAKGAKYAEDGTRLSFELMGYTSFEPLQKTEEFIVENLKAVGVEARIQNVDFSIIFGSFSEGAPSKLGDFDATIYDRGLYYEPSGQVSNRYASMSIPSAENPNGSNEKRWLNPEVDKLIAEADGTFDTAKRKEAYCKLGQLIVDDIPELYFYLFQDGCGFSSRLHGYRVNTWGTMSWDVQNWWVEE